MRFAIGLRHGMIESASRFWQIPPVAFEGAHKSFQFRTYRISTFRGISKTKVRQLKKQDGVVLMWPVPWRKRASCG